MSNTTHPLLSDLPTVNKKEDCLRAVIETPKGSSDKYDYDPEYGCFVLSKTLPEGLAFPFDFGFIPSTKGQDGDPLDVLVLMDFPALMGAVIDIALIGCLKAEQKSKGKKLIRNDRFIAIARSSRTLADVKSLSDLRTGLLEEVVQFFVQYNKLEGKKFHAIGTCGAKQAMSLVKAGMRNGKGKD